MHHSKSNFVPAPTAPNCTKASPLHGTALHTHTLCTHCIAPRLQRNTHSQPRQTAYLTVGTPIPPPANPPPRFNPSKIGFHAFFSSSLSGTPPFHSNLHPVMADQCIVCLENLDSAIPLQQLQGGDDGGPSGGGLSVAAPATATPASADPQPLPLAAASPTASSTTTNDTSTTAKDCNFGSDSTSDSNENVAVIQVCGHILHDSCLKAWSGKANSCPICRQAFHLVEVYDKIGGESPRPAPRPHPHKLTCRTSNRHPPQHIQSPGQETSGRIRSLGVA